MSPRNNINMGPAKFHISTYSGSRDSGVNQRSEINTVEPDRVKLEVDKLKNMFIKNAYPAWFFHKTYKIFLDKIKNTQVPNTDTGEENQFKFNLSIPYIGKQSKNICTNY